MAPLDRRRMGVICIVAVGVLALVCMRGRAPDAANAAAGPETGATANAQSEARRGVARVSGPPTSIVQLLANPERYDGKWVRVKGFLLVHFEGDSIYLSEKDAEYGVTSNALSLEFAHDVLGIDVSELRRRFDHRYVLLEGTFNAGDPGHMSLWYGTIERVSRVAELWSKNDSEKVASQRRRNQVPPVP